MKAKKNDIVMTNKLNALIDMGFDVSQGISNAYLGGMCFDLGVVNINKDDVFAYVIMRSYRSGFNAGRDDIKQKFNKLLN